MLRSGYVRLDDRFGIDEGMGVTSKLEAVQTAFSKAYDDAAKTLNARSFDEAMSQPWLTSVDPVTYGQQLMQQHWICQRLIEVLEPHLVDQNFVQASIERRLKVVRDRIHDQIDDVPDAIVEFARRVHHSGLKAASVRDFRADDVDLIAGAFNTRDASAMSPVFRPRRKPMTDVEREELLANARRIGAERAAARPPEPEPAPVISNVHSPDPSVGHRMARYVEGCTAEVL